MRKVLRMNVSDLRKEDQLLVRAIAELLDAEYVTVTGDATLFPRVEFGCYNWLRKRIGDAVIGAQQLRVRTNYLKGFHRAIVKLSEEEAQANL